MTSSPSSSSRPGLPALAALLAIAAGCATAPPAPPLPDRGPIRRVVLLPFENLSGTPVPVRDLLAPAERALAARGLEVVSGEPVQQYLARHRIRSTGSVDGAGAAGARDELGADGVVVTSVETWRDSPAAQFALTMRLVRAAEDAELLWIDGYGRTGDDAPGLLALGLVSDVKVLEAEAFARMADSMARHLERKGPASPACSRGLRFEPVFQYRSTTLSPQKRYSVAVVPFLNRTRRRGAGELAALAFVRQLRASRTFTPVEPGQVRRVLLQQRIVLEGGVSLEAARLLLGVLDADLVLGGEVLEYEDSGPPRVNLTATVLDRGSGEVVWQSLSHNRGDDWVFFFDVGRVSTALALGCSMVGNVVDGMSGDTPATESAFKARR
ncbi:MAG: hypothetical protein HZB56_23220 [Deltaproteobacteria bacterium]|nr:hypothetical protein [Deltaproteobacteria bacterium]